MKTLVIIWAFVTPGQNFSGFVERIEIPATMCAEATKDLNRASPMYLHDPDNGYYSSVASWCE
jgi:hypothetical protein